MYTPAAGMLEKTISMVDTPSVPFDLEWSRKSWTSFKPGDDWLSQAVATNDFTAGVSVQTTETINGANMSTWTIAQYDWRSHLSYTVSKVDLVMQGASTTDVTVTGKFSNDSGTSSVNENAWKTLAMSTEFDYSGVSANDTAAAAGSRDSSTPR